MLIVSFIRCNVNTVYNTYPRQEDVSFCRKLSEIWNVSGADLASVSRVHLREFSLRSSFPVEDSNWTDLLAVQVSVDRAGGVCSRRYTCSIGVLRWSQSGPMHRRL